MNEIDNNLLYNLIIYNKYRKYCFNNSIKFKENRDYERKLKARYNKVGRVKKRFLYLALRYKYLYFVTFTFDDNFIKKCDRSKKDLIKNTLYSFDEDIKYIINIDYGSKNEREHYHGIIATNCDLNFITYMILFYPFIAYTEKIRIDSKSIKKVSKYINKLSNHACKESTKNSRVLYNFKGYDKFDKEEQRLLYFFDKIKVGLT